MKISVGNSRTSRAWKIKEFSWEKFVQKCSQTIRTAETVQEYRKLPKGQQDNIKDVGGFVGGELRSGLRRKDTVINRCLLTLDADYADEDFWEQIELFFNFKCLIYSTHKHTAQTPRFRLIIPLSRPVTADEYTAVARRIAADIGIEQFDDTTYQPHRLMYWPSTSSDGEFVFQHRDVENSIQNLTIILQNDPKLKGIVFNELSDCIEINGDVPWQHPSKYWRDADDAQLLTYLTYSYGKFTRVNYDVALAKVVDDRSFHPIRQYLDGLPKWDKQKRVDTLLTDYLGAEDNPYTRAVIRKTLCGAVARVMVPGIKFDTMLVLSGPQGIGKSTIISKLCGEWFNDSLLLSDTKDKTAAEKLQGFWILEIGELAGLKKTEIETLRGFISRQNDVFRASFGRRATPHLRQCIFIGTTNAEHGYLRDTTGNRRFFPVKVSGNSKKKPWQLSQSDIDQIWAEVLVYYKRGEPLILDEQTEKLAKKLQREAMETDEREGMVREYLETLLPVNWNEMSLYERRNFLDGSEFGEVNIKGEIKRQKVCNMEIWCECFGKAKADLKRIDANAISAIMAKIEGWQKMSKKSRFGIYGAAAGYERTEV